MVPNCSQCGAALAVDATVCPYCHAATAYGVAAQRRAEEDERARLAAAAAAREHEARVAHAKLEGVSRSALFWSMAALVACCLPGPQVMAIVRYASARAMASRMGVALPGQATAGLVIAIASIGLGVAAITYAVIDQERQQTASNERVAALSSLVQGATAPVLSPNVACAVAEVHLRTQGFEKVTGFRVTSFECNGRLTVSGERADLADIRFRAGQKVQPLRACFKRGEKWFVESFTEGAPCDAPSSAQQ